jgi:hypothetical protein
MPLNIAPSILERLDAGVLAMAVGDLEHTDFSCAACEDNITAGTTEQLELLLFEDPDGRGAVLKYAHSRCAKSDIQVRRFPPLPGHFDTAFTPMMRDHVLAPTIVWELVGGVRVESEASSGPMVDPIAEGLRRHGFRFATQRLGDLVAPLAPGWALVQHGDDLLLRSPDRGRADEFSGAMMALPAGWLQAVRRSKRVLVVYGSGFGLERVDFARIARVMQAGAAVAALVKWSGAPPSSRRKRR